MSQANVNETEMIFVFDVKGKKAIYFGKIAEMMESLFFKNNSWLKAVKLKKQICNVENKRILFMEIESENK